MKNILGLPKAVINSDDELMGISINYYPKEDEWSICYADEGSSISAKGKTLKKLVKNIRKEHKQVYNCEIEENS